MSKLKIKPSKAKKVKKLRADQVPAEFRRSLPVRGDDGLTAEEILEAYNGAVASVSRAILMGLVQPESIIGPEIQLGVAETMVGELTELKGDFRFTHRVERGLTWAARDDVAPEMAIFFGQQAIGLCDPEQKDTVADTDGYKAYRTRLGHIIDTLYE